MSAQDRVTDLASRLAAHPYARASGDLVRYRDDPDDDVLAEVVRAAAAEDGLGAEIARHGLGADAADPLALFAMRRVLQARRRSSLGAAFEALDAFALLPPHDVPWDSWVKGALFAARDLGGDPEQLTRRFDEVASAAGAKAFGVALDAMERVEDLSQCRLIELRTDYGIGLIETLLFRDRPTYGFYGAPSIGAHQIGYAPTTNLAALTVRLADALDSTGRVTTGPITQDQLAATLVSVTTAGSYVMTNGCLSFVAAGTDGGNSYSVFVAELPEEVDVDELARGATVIEDQSAIFDAQRLVVMSAQPRFDDVDEDENLDDDLDHFEELARIALADPSNR